MAYFIDNENRKWTVSINLATVGSVYKGTGVSIHKLFEDKGKPFQELLDNLPVFANVLYLICLKQVESLGLDEEGFLNAIYGESLEKAKDAFDEALVDFFPEPQKGLVKKMIQGGKKVQQKIAKRVEQATAEIDIEKMANQVVQHLLHTNKSKTPSGKKPVSSASATSGT